ncbi:glycosyltransferase family 4 protein [Thermosynechococcaceae cyanobacterium Okahandja]
MTAKSASDPLQVKTLSILLLCNSAQMLLNFRGELIVDLTEAGFDVHCLAPDYSELEKTKLAALGARCHNFYLVRNSINPLDDIKALFSLIKTMKQIRPDCILAISSKPIVWGLLASRFVNIKLRFALFTGLGYAFTPTAQSEHKPLKKLLIFLYKLTLPFADKIIFQNQDDCDEITEICSLKQDQTIVIKGTGVNLQEWPFCPPHLNPLTFTLVARLLIEKGVLEFLAAAKHLKAIHPQVQFWLIGGLDTNPGGLREAQLDEFINSGIVKWFGFANVKDYLPTTSVFVLPSYREGVPRSTQEAMAMGRPVITTDVPGCRETVVDGHNGFLIPPRDVSALIDAMQKFIDKPELISPMGYNSYQMAADLFDVKKINAQYLKLLREC